jgi:hypothetical protein
MRSVLQCGGPPPLFLLPAVVMRQDQSARALAQSKTCRLWLWLCLLPFALCLQAWGQAYTVDWSTIDGGGATSTGGVYSASGTIGQPDAGGPMTNGQYSVTGGFWALPILVQTPGSPTLHIINAAPGFATIWWTPAVTGFALQETPSLSPTNWVNSSSGTNNPATVPATLPKRFYRLLNTGQ